MKAERVSLVERSEAGGQALIIQSKGDRGTKQ